MRTNCEPTAQAIVVGSGTALADRPSLTVRGVALEPRVAPQRVLLDGRGRVPATGPLFDTDARADARDHHGSRAVRRGRRVVRGRREGRRSSRPARGGGVDLDEAFALLAARGRLQVLVEGGGALRRCRARGRPRVALRRVRRAGAAR